MVYEISGLPSILARFFNGIALDPPLARITPIIFFMHFGFS